MMDIAGLRYARHLYQCQFLRPRPLWITSGVFFESHIRYCAIKMYELESVLMAGKSGSKPQAKSSGDGSWKGFVNVNLTEADKKQIKQASPDLSELAEDITAVIVSGHRVQLSKHPDKNNVVCTFTGAYAHCVNLGFSLSSFAPDVTTAISVNLYKHFTLLGGKWSESDAIVQDEIG